MVETQDQTKPARYVAELYVLGTAGFGLAGVLLRARPEPLAAELVGLLASLAVLAAAFRDPRPRAWRTLVRIGAGVLAAVLAGLVATGR